ncbi:MAG: cysteine hydrolase family protein [bacterium]|jgi:nicotinamidase-related amidase|nr:cysteine hydrolase [Caldisericota bacterium]
MKPGKRALLVVDMIRDFVDPGAPLEVPATREIIPFIKERIAHYREAGLPVIFISDCHEPTDFEMNIFPLHALRGTPGAKIVDELAPAPGEILVPKKTYSGFVGTPLEEILRKEGVDEVEVVGCVTNICVFFTSADACMRGFQVYIPRKGVAALSKEEGEMALEQLTKLFAVKIT